MIGDSVVEGQGAPEDLTIAAELARLQADDGLPDEVINLGVIVASLHQLTPLVRDAVGLLKPKEVVLVLYANDLPAPTYPSELDLASPRFRRRAEPWWIPRAVELIERLAQNEPSYRRWPHVPVRLFAPVPDPSNPWTGSAGPPRQLDPTIYRAMVAGTLNSRLKEQSEAIPRMLAQDFNQGGSPMRYLLRMPNSATRPMPGFLWPTSRSAGPSTQGMHRRWSSWGCDPRRPRGSPEIPSTVVRTSIWLRLCAVLGLPTLADATEDLVRAEAAGTPQYRSFDTHPRPAGYATIARRIHDAMRVSQ